MHRCLRNVTSYFAFIPSSPNSFLLHTVSQDYFAQSSEFLGKKNIFGTKVASEVFLSISQNVKVTRLQGGHKRNFELVDKTLIF